jgi:hypothetical protein
METTKPTHLAELELQHREYDRQLNVLAGKTLSFPR